MLIIGLSFVFTSPSFSLKSMTVESMKNATAQAADVSMIPIDNDVVEKWLGANTYKDDDVSKAISIDGEEGNYGSPIKADAGVCEFLTAYSDNPSKEGSSLVSGIVIGLPIRKIEISGDTYISTAPAGSGAANDGGEYARVTTTGRTQQILGGHVEIAPH
jgi:hypothetical protein